ncbi:MAG: hypothetical protein RLZ44_1235 [Pseudomonadota bacterium]
MNWLHSRLNRKFGLGTATGLLVSSLVFLVLYLALYRGELASERGKAAAQVNNLLQTALENAMLKRDLEGLRFIVERLGRQPGIEAVFITNPGGEIRFASEAALLGGRHPPDTDGDAAATRFLVDPQGRDILRSINPVANRPQCKECHGPAEERPINGILYVDYDAAPIRQQAKRTTLLLMGAGAIIVLINLAGGWWFIRRQVIRPINHLTVTSQALAHGDLAQRVAPSGNDELAQLGRAFDRMADELQAQLTELQQQRVFLQNLVDAIPDGVRVIAPDYRVLLTNQAYRQQLQLGAANSVGEPCHRASHASAQPCPSTLVTCPVHEISLKAEPVKALHRHHRADGEVIDVEIYAAPLQASLDGRQQTLVVESIRDLSKQIRYSHEQKLSELGKLATGVAHEIHNPLASVRLALHALHASAGSGNAAEVREYIELVDREVDKCVGFTERLLRLGMPPPASPELVEVATVFEDTLSLVRWEAEHLGITLRTELTPALRVLATDSEMRMVALNLIQNAFHAMPRGGALLVASRSDGRWVSVDVQDTGIGIAAEQLSRIFDPFYSRRADGAQGTGLGLSIVRTIVEHYGGEISVQSEPGHGSTFSVRLPDPAAQSEDAV